MLIESYPELEAQVWEWLRRRMKELSGPRSSGIHMTELIYCLTKTYYDRLENQPVTNEGNLLMGLGIGLERLFIPEEMRATPKSRDGIEYSPDFWFGNHGLCELKTTRQGINRARNRDFPDTWIQQIKGYCYAENQTDYGLVIVHLVGEYQKNGFQPLMSAWKFQFEPDELKQIWDYFLFRRQALFTAFSQQVAPTPYRWCQEWECKYCQYRKEKCG